MAAQDLVQPVYRQCSPCPASTAGTGRRRERRSAMTGTRLFAEQRSSSSTAWAIAGQSARRIVAALSAAFQYTTSCGNTVLERARGGIVASQSSTNDSVGALTTHEARGVHVVNIKRFKTPLELYGAQASGNTTAPTRLATPTYPKAARNSEARANRLFTSSAKA